MEILRGPDDITDGFVITVNEVAQMKCLSFRARGLHQFIRSLPPGWRTTTAEIAANHCTEGRDAVRKAMSELEGVRLVKRQKYQDPKTGRWTTRMICYARPQPAETEAAPPLETQVEPPAPDFPAEGIEEPSAPDFPAEGIEGGGKTAGHTEDGFPGVGEPGVGEPGVGKPGVITHTDPNTHTKTEKKTKKQQAGKRRTRENQRPADPACLPADSEQTQKPKQEAPADTPGAELLRRLPERLATSQVIRQHAPAVDVLLEAWPADRLYRRLASECDGPTGPGRLVQAIRDTPPAPPVRVLRTVVNDSSSVHGPVLQPDAVPPTPPQVTETEEERAARDAHRRKLMAEASGGKLTFPGETPVRRPSLVTWREPKNGPKRGLSGAVSDENGSTGPSVAEA